ncbi:MAG: polyprenyl synthetase family protein [Nitrospirae bacterium]|nr:polyprenyl synthetase family protein [Nitrospirota bacterium]
MGFKDVVTILQEDLKRVEAYLKRNFQSDVTLIPTISSYLSNGGGKRLRPILVLAASKLCGYNGGDRHIRYSCVVELIHAATLLHDDVVDEADIRRGIPSANAKWGNDASVLVGDYLFSMSFSLMAEECDKRIITLMSDVSRKVAEGEVKQLICKYDLDTAEDVYIDVISRKTAALISACCGIGAMLGGVTHDKEDALISFGENIGIAFQLIDDVLDYTSNEIVLGKPVGNDLSEGKVTLPLIHLYKEAKEKERDELKEIVKSYKTCSKRSESIGNEQLKRIIYLMNNYGSIDYTMNIARKYIENAKSDITPLMQASSEKYFNALISLADYILERKN